MIWNCIGNNRIKFLKDDSEITFNMPSPKITGIAFGSPRLNFTGELQVSYSEYFIDAAVDFEEGELFEYLL